MTRLVPYCVMLGCLLFPMAARAFSDPALFTEGTLLGGGGGRFFTGSPVDGYSCAVCHDGGPKPLVNVIGLPLDGYDPGVTYQVELQWDEPAISHALALELVTLSGQGAGMLTLPPAAQIAANGRCEQNPASEVAAYLVQSKTRSIVAINDCGATSLRFNFTAPIDYEVAFAATVVRGDGSGTSEGDGVVELSKVLHRRGVSTTTRGTTTCSTSASTSDPSLRGPLLTLSGLMLTGLLQRRRMHRAKARSY